MLLALALVTGCAVPAPADSSKKGEQKGRVVLPSGQILQVEVADTPEKRQRGYMFRERVSDTEGMVFLMEEIGFHPFWMKNCKVSLDIIWLDESWKVVHLEPRVPPCLEDPCPSYLPMQAGLYVLEVQAGLAGREKLRRGDRIIFEPLPDSAGSPPGAGVDPE